MASGDTRTRHARHPSRISRLTATNARQNAPLSQDNDAETIAYIKRILCAKRSGSRLQNGMSTRPDTTTPLNELLPPLTSSNEVDIQLYAIISVILDQFVRSWYTRITVDPDFIGEIVKIIAHCTRGIEQRLKNVDLEELLLDELPALFLAHTDAVAIALDACANDRPSSDARLIFHSIRPNKALAPVPDTPSHIAEQQDNESAWAQLLVSRILPLVLPPEDLQNPCLHVLVSEIFSQIVICNAVCNRGSEAWVIWEGVTKLIRSLSRSTSDQAPSPGDSLTQSTNKLQQFGLVSRPVPQDEGQVRVKARRRIDAIAQIFWSALHTISITWLLLRTVVKALMQDTSVPARSIRRREDELSNKVSVTAEGDPRRGPAANEAEDKQPIVSMRIWSCISRLGMLEHRMPWIYGLVSLLQWLLLHGPGKVCSTDGALDRLLSSEIHAKLLRADLMPRLLIVVRSALFPGNVLAPTRQPPTSAETLEIKRECAKTIVETIPPIARNSYFATRDTELMYEDAEKSLDCLADSYINKHLIVSALELIVVRLFPELGEGSAED